MGNLKVIANEMLPVYETSKGEKVVDARELHQHLMSKQHFTDWIKKRLNNYGFVEGEDYSSFHNSMKREMGGTVRIEYLLTLDTAKEIAMLENNEMGRAIRKYFIEVEKQVKQKQPQTQLEILQMTINQMVAQEQRVNQIEHNQIRLEQNNQLLQQENEVLKHRIDNLDHVDVIGDKRQRLNAMVRKLATQRGIPYGSAWKDFVQSFNTAYKTNFELRRQNHINKIGKDVSRPQFLEDMGLLEDAIRVVDKMLNQRIAN